MNSSMRERLTTMTHPAQPTGRSASGRSRLFALALWGCAIAFVWLVVLPWWSTRSAMRARIEWLRARQIDPSAMVYSELDAMKPILHKLNQKERGE